MPGTLSDQSEHIEPDGLVADARKANEEIELEVEHCP